MSSVVKRGCKCIGCRVLRGDVEPPDEMVFDEGTGARLVRVPKVCQGCGEFFKGYVFKSGAPSAALDMERWDIDEEAGAVRGWCPVCLEKEHSWRPAGARQAHRGQPAVRSEREIKDGEDRPSPRQEYLDI